MWKFEPGGQDYDPEYQYGEDGRWAVQDCTRYGAGYQVNEYTITDDDFEIRHWGNHRTLKAAKAEVKRLASQ